MWIPVNYFCYILSCVYIKHLIHSNMLDLKQLLVINHEYAHGGVFAH